MVIICVATHCTLREYPPIGIAKAHIGRIFWLHFYSSLYILIKTPRFRLGPMVHERMKRTIYILSSAILQISMFLHHVPNFGLPSPGSSNSGRWHAGLVLFDVEYHNVGFLVLCLEKGTADNKLYPLKKYLFTHRLHSIWVYSLHLDGQSFLVSPIAKA